MIVVKTEHLNQVSKIAKEMGCYYSYNSIHFEGMDLHEIHSSSRLFLYAISKNIMKIDKDLELFIKL